MYRTKTGYQCANFLRRSPKQAFFLAAVVLSLAFTGCVQNQANSNAPVASAPVNSQNTSNTNTNQAPAQTETAESSNMPITMPVVDALLSDETFLADVRKSVQPSDEQLDKLKNAARDSVLKLGEDDEQEGRSTRTSISDAEKQVRQILGNENGDKFLALARKHWSGGEAASAANPNSIPTDTRIVVNAPGYRMDLFREGKLVKSYKVGIGYPEFPLPTGVRTAKSIIFNPPWTPPDEPWVKGEFQPGKKVEAGSKKNPLGFIKIPIGLPSLIHGGKDPSRLGTFASHGCVGLTNPLVQDFAVELAKLSGSDLNPQQVKEYEQKRSETKEINLSQSIPVELRYETIVAEDGKLHIYRDVYEHGTNTEENLARVLQTYGLSMNDLSPDEQTKVRDALKKMATDPQGKPVDEDESNTNTNTNKKASKSDKVTRTIKGQKEVVVDIAALRGKGYPAPVNINS
ncbi:MAG TPA: L,D-transpeptidase [Pyrinomonadaceae bacterium]|nr:L,D-transpeptidase [Pyrinomonadaceae bacterium]